MSPEVKSVTAAFALVFVVLAARHQWLPNVWGWLKAPAKGSSSSSSSPPAQPAPQTPVGGTSQQNSIRPSPS